MKNTMLGRALAVALLLGTASAAQAGGYYQAPGAGGGTASPNSDPIPYDSGYTVPTNGAQFGAQAAFTINRVACVGVTFRASTSVAYLGSRVAVAATSGTKMAFAVYADALTSVGHRPVGAPLGSTGDLVVSSAGPNSGFAGMAAVAAVGNAAGTSFPVTRNTRYWACYQTDSNVQMATTAGGSSSALSGQAMTAGAAISTAMPTTANSTQTLYMAFT